MIRVRDTLARTALSLQVVALPLSAQGRRVSETDFLSLLQGTHPEGLFEAFLFIETLNRCGR